MAEQCYKTVSKRRIQQDNLAELEVTDLRNPELGTATEDTLQKIKDVLALVAMDRA